MVSNKKQSVDNPGNNSFSKNNRLILQQMTLVIYISRSVTAIGLDRQKYR